MSHERWRFAQLHQHDYQRKKRHALAGQESVITDHATVNSVRVGHLLQDLGFSVSEGLVIEVGSGAHGLIWKWPAEHRVAVDPLAHHYRKLFPSLQRDGPVILAAQGERLPLAPGIADLVLSDNVIDHVEAPGDYLGECRRIMKPGGTLFFTVDIHHPVWWWGGRLYNGLFRLGFRGTVPAFPNHPFHFTERRITKLLRDCGFREIQRWGGQSTVQKGFGVRFRGLERTMRDSEMEEAVKQIFFKNVRLEIVATAPAEATVAPQ